MLLVDPYNDFLGDGGKLAGLAKVVADEVDTLNNLRQVVAAVRAADLHVFYVQHHRATPQDFQGWKHPSPYQLGAGKAQVFAVGSWGGEWHPDFLPQPDDVVVKEHWGGSGFAEVRRADTLIIRGDDDQIVPIDAASRASAELIKNSKLIVYEGAPHGITDTYKERLNADLLVFVQS